MSPSPAPRVNLNDVLTRIVPGALPASILAAIALETGLISASNMTQSWFILALLSVSLIFGEIVDLYRVDVPPEFRKVLHYGEGIEDKLSIPEKFVFGHYARRTFAQIPFIEPRPVIRVGHSYDLTPTEFSSELKEVLSVSDEHAEELRTQNPELYDANLYHGLLNYVFPRASKTIKQRKSKYIFQRNSQVSIGLSAVILNVYVILTFWGTNFDHLIIISTVLGSAVVFQYFALYFKRAEMRYIRSLISSFHVIREQETGELNLKDNTRSVY